MSQTRWKEIYKSLKIRAFLSIIITKRIAKQLYRTLPTFFLPKLLTQYETTLTPIGQTKHAPNTTNNEQHNFHTTRQWKNKLELPTHHTNVHVQRFAVHESWKHIINVETIKDKIP